MSTQSLFGHLATKFGAHPENLATEALHYVIGRSSSARRGLLRYFVQAGVTFPDDVTFRTQVFDEDNAIPDLIGANADAQPVLIIEAKFWAGLTQKQPVTYLNRLTDRVDALLAFIAPARRLPSLWPELLRRCRADGLAVVPTREDSFFRSAHVGDKRLALTGWGGLLSYLSESVQADQQPDAAADLAQLQGLCVRMDEDAFLPLRSEELTGSIGLRIQQFSQLVGEVADECISKGFAFRKTLKDKKLKAATGLGWSGRYLRLSDVVCCLFFSAENWSRLRPTPLWLSISNERGEWVPSKALREALSPIERKDPEWVIVPEKGAISIPLPIPVGVEKDQVVAVLVAHLQYISQLLRVLSPSSQAEITDAPLETGPKTC